MKPQLDFFRTILRLFEDYFEETMKLEFLKFLSVLFFSINLVFGESNFLKFPAWVTKKFFLLFLGG